MSKVDVKAGAEENFIQKLDIQMVTTSVYASLMDVLAAEGCREALAAVGGSGIGKSAIPRQVAKSRNAPYVPLHVPQMNIEDFHIPTMAADTKQFYDRRIPRKFQTLMEYCEKLRKENNGDFPKGRNPILAIEELNRAVDKSVTRAMFTLLDDRTIGDTTLDPAIQIVVTMNPTGGGMMVNEFEKDPAMRRRLLLVGVTFSYGEFMRYAKTAKIHSQVIEHLEAQPKALYDRGAAEAGRVFSCPATWEAVSRVCFALEASDKTLYETEAVAAFSGAIGATATEAFVEFVRDRTVVIAPEDVLRGYKEKSPVRTRLRKLIADGRNDHVTNLCEGLSVKLFDDPDRKPESFAKQLALFMEDLPEEMTQSFFTQIQEQSKSDGKGGSNNAKFMEIGALIAKDPSFHVTADRLLRAKKKGKDEAKKSGLTT